MSVITWIGLGNMGLPMATLLVQAGHNVRGVEINPSVSTAAEAVGITVYPSAAQATAGADAVVTMLSTGDHVREMLLGPSGLFAASVRAHRVHRFLDHRCEMRQGTARHGRGRQQKVRRRAGIGRCRPSSRRHIGVHDRRI